MKSGRSIFICRHARGIIEQTMKQFEGVMTKNAQRVTVTLAGKKYTIKGEASMDHVQATEALFNQQFKQIQTVAPKLNYTDQAMLLTFNALSNQLKQQDQIDALTQRNQQLEAQLAAQQHENKGEQTPVSNTKNTIEAAKQASHLKRPSLFNQQP